MSFVVDRKQRGRMVSWGGLNKMALSAVTHSCFPKTNTDETKQKLMKPIISELWIAVKEVENQSEH